MSDPDPKDYLLDLLSPLARAERRNLLLASVAGLLSLRAGLVPEKISALGIEFSAPEQSSFLIILACVIGYFFAAFLLYAAADFFVWRKKIYEYAVHIDQKGRDMTQEEQEEYDDLHSTVKPIHWYYQKSPQLAVLVAVFDFGIPLLAGIYTISALIARVVT